ncbi:unnamed protein product [Gordionus sp. m RMFG-2023]
MNNESLIKLLEATLNPSQKDIAENQLKELNVIPGFSQMVLQVIVSENYNMPIRQAAAIYFKNYITKNWHHIETDFQHQESKIVIIIESDKIIIKDNIIEAIIHSPDILRSQLALCVNTMIKYDYPNKWPKLLNKLEIFLKDNNYDICLGGLNCLHQLVKNYEYFI